VSERRLIHSRLELKFWTGRVPSVEGVRPQRCTGCGAASRCPGKRLGVVGHGVRRRQLRGPAKVGGEPEEQTVVQRRFRCRSCGAVMVVAPAQVLRRRLFSTTAVVWALVLFGVEGVAAARVRSTISPWQVVGATAVPCWQALKDWIRASGAGRLLPVKSVLGAPRRLAARLVWALTALAPPSFRGEPVAHQAVSGALHALMGITP